MSPAADIWTKMKSDTTASTMVEYPFSIIIDTDDNFLLGENVEFE